MLELPHEVLELPKHNDLLLLQQPKVPQRKGIGAKKIQ